MLDLTTLGAGAIVLLAALAAWWNDRRKQFKKGQEATKAEANQDALDRTEQGRAAVRDGRASGDSPVDRLRENDGQW